MQDVRSGPLDVTLRRGAERPIAIVPPLASADRDRFGRCSLLIPTAEVLVRLAIEAGFVAPFAGVAVFLLQGHAGEVPQTKTGVNELEREGSASPCLGVAERFKPKLPHRPKDEAVSAAYRDTLEGMEASPGIEPGYKDLQSSASPLRHEAIRTLIERVVTGV